MRIGLVHNSLNGIGGAERFAVVLIDALKRRGHHVTLATFDKTDWKRLGYHFGKVARPDREVSLLGFKLRAFGVYQGLVPSLGIQFLRKCHVVMDTHGGVYMRLPFLKGKVDVTYVHGGLGYFPNVSSVSMTKYRKGFWRFYYEPYRALTGLASKHPSLLLTNSKWSQKTLFRRLGFKAEVVYPPIDTSNSELAENKSRKNEVLTLARISKEKTLGMVGEMASKLPQITFHVAGITSVDSPDILRKLQKPNIQLHLNPSWKTIRHLQAVCKVFLNTTEYEAFGMAIAESMSTGCIPVVYDSGGVSEFVTEGCLFKTVDEAVELIKGFCSSWSVEESKFVSRSVDWLNGARFADEICPIIEGCAEHGFAFEKAKKIPIELDLETPYPTLAHYVKRGVRA